MSEQYLDPIAQKLLQIEEEEEGNQKEWVPSRKSKSNIREQLSSLLENVIPNDTKLTSWIQKNIDEKTGVNTTTTKKEYIEQVVAADISGTSRKFILLFVTHNKEKANIQELLDAQLELHVELQSIYARLHKIHFNEKQLDMWILQYKTSISTRMSEELSTQELEKMHDDTLNYEKLQEVYIHYQKHQHVIVDANTQKIERKIYEYITGDKRVSDGEIQALVTMIENSKKIFQIQNTLEERKSYIHKFVREEVQQELIKHTQNIETTGTEELQRIEGTIESEYILFQRVQMLLLHSMDVKWIDYFVEKKSEYKEFFYQFTKAYINLAREKKQKVNYKDTLSLSNTEIEHIIKSIPPATYDTINRNIDIAMKGEEQPINIAHHIEKIQLMRNEKVAAVYALWSLSRHVPYNTFSAEEISRLLGIPSSDQIVKKMEKIWLLSGEKPPLSEIQNSLKGSNRLVSITHIKELLKSHIKPGTRSLLEFLRKLSDNHIISRSLALSLIEPEGWFQIEPEGWFQKNQVSLWKSLEDIGIPENIHMLVAKILEKDIKEIPEKRIQKFLQFFLYIESSGGYNVANYARKSSAKGYFQYLTMNGKWKKNERWIMTRRGNSYESAIRRFARIMRKMYLSQSKKKKLMVDILNIKEVKMLYPNIAQQSKLEKQQEKQNPMVLSSEEQIALFLSDILQNPKSKKYIHDIFFKTNTNKTVAAIQWMYAHVHHSNPDGSTKKLIKTASRKYF